MRSPSARAAIAEQLEKQFERFLGEDGGAMSKVLDAHSDELAELVAQHFGGDRSTAVQHQIKEIVAKALTDSRQDLLRQFSAEDGHNPLADFKAAVVREVKRSGESQREADREDRPARGRGQAAARRARGRGRAGRRAGARHAQGPRVRAAVFEARRARSPPRAATSPTTSGDVRSASGGKKGDIVIEVDAASGPAKGADRDRRQGRAALEEPRLGGAQRGARRARRRLRDPGGGLRREGARRPRAAPGVRGQQDDRRARQGDARPARRSSSPTAMRAAGCLMAAEARAGARRRRRPRRRRGGAVGAARRPEDPQLAHRRDQGRRRRPRGARRDGRAREGEPGAGRVADRGRRG